MVKVDYISTTDINKVAKIHSNKKYINWNLKIVDNEYRFYPPIVVEYSEDELDDFDFSMEEDDSSYLDTLLSSSSIEKKETPMFGEFWEKTTKFFTEDKFHLVGYLEESITEKKMRKIKKGMNSVARIEKYQESFGDAKRRISKNMCRSINKAKIKALSAEDESYKLFSVEKGSSVLSKINKYKDEKLEEADKIIETVEDKIELLTDDIEILSFDKEYA